MGKMPSLEWTDEDVDKLGVDGINQMIHEFDADAGALGLEVVVVSGMGKGVYRLEMREPDYSRLKGKAASV